MKGSDKDTVTITKKAAKNTPVTLSIKALTFLAELVVFRSAGPLLVSIVPSISSSSSLGITHALGEEMISLY